MAIFAHPTPHLQIYWDDIGRLVVACGGKVLAGQGSVVRLVMGSIALIYIARTLKKKSKRIKLR